MLREIIQNIGIILANLLIYLSICTKAEFYFRQSFANDYVLPFFHLPTLPTRLIYVYAVAKIIGSRMTRNRAWKLDSKRADGSLHETRSRWRDSCQRIFVSLARIISKLDHRSTECIEFTRLPSLPIINSWNRDVLFESFIIWYPNYILNAIDTNNCYFFLNFTTLRKKFETIYMCKYVVEIFFTSFKIIFLYYKIKLIF